MKRFLYSSLFMALAGAGGLPAGSPSGQQPVEVYLYARITDHINLDVTEARLRRLLPMLDRLRKERPDGHVSATLLFSGAASAALEERNGRTHIVDYVKDYIRRGVVEAGYDGADEPTLKVRPWNDFSKTKTAEDRWLVRTDTAEKMLTQGRDPLKGTLDPNKVGGLKKMQEVFGTAACITGVTLATADAMVGFMPEVGPDSEMVHELRRLNTQAIMFGVPDGSPVHGPGPLYRAWALKFSRDVSPVPETSPELYWQDNVLRSSESSKPDLRLFRASDGPEAFQKVIASLDRSRIRIVHVELANPKSYLTQKFFGSALSFGYDHPDNPMLPAEARRPAADVDAAYAKEEGTLKWISEFLPSNAGSHFVSSAALREMAGPSTGYEIDITNLRTALEDTLRNWGAEAPTPAYVLVSGHYLSLADTFQVTTDALAAFSRDGKLPASVRVVPVFGPTETTKDHGVNAGEVTVASIARACAALSPRLHDAAWSAVPKNSIPFQVKVDGIDLNAAQFLRLMAQAVVNPAQAKLQVSAADMFWSQDAIFIRTRSIRDEGATWTIKPAILKVPGAGV